MAPNLLKAALRLPSPTEGGWQWTQMVHSCMYRNSITMKEGREGQSAVAHEGERSLLAVCMPT